MLAWRGGEAMVGLVRGLSGFGIEVGRVEEVVFGVVVVAVVVKGKPLALRSGDPTWLKLGEVMPSAPLLSEGLGAALRAQTEM